ncbi:hypothetical protein ACOME3_004608 [Neoechinorhynchus agilis]
MKHCSLSVGSTGIPLPLLKRAFDENPECRRALLELLASQKEFDKDVAIWIEEIFENYIKLDIDDDLKHLATTAKLTVDLYPFDTILRIIQLPSPNCEFVNKQLESFLQSLQSYENSTLFQNANESHLSQQIVSIANCVDEWAQIECANIRVAVGKAKAILRFYQFMHKFVIVGDFVAKATGSHLQTSMASFILAVQTLDNSRKPQTVKRTRSRVNKVVNQTQLARVIPQIVHAMESYETALVALSKKRSINFLRYFKLTPSRDFRIDKNQI